MRPRISAIVAPSLAVALLLSSGPAVVVGCSSDGDNTNNGGDTDNPDGDGDCTADCNGLMPSTHCVDLDPNLFSGGTLACTSDCLLDISGCESIACGADCAGQLPFADCALLDVQYREGTATCDPVTCEADLSGCVPFALGEREICNEAMGETCEPQFECRWVDGFNSFSRCLRPCDPTVAASCGVRRTCVQVSAADVHDGLCFTADDIEREELDPCFGFGQGSCEADLLCAQVAGLNASRTCVETCDPNVAGSCGIGRTCILLSLQAPNDGVCVAGSPAGAGESCVGVGQGSCDAGLMCIVATLGQPGVCAPACDTGSPACLSAQYCHPSDPLSTSTLGGCWETAAEGGTCLPFAPAQACSSPGTECAAIDVGLAHECKETCSGGDVGGGQATCSSGEVCLAAPFVEIEQDSGKDKACSQAGAQDVCTPNYVCSRVNVGGGEIELLCARHEGWCGRAATLHTKFRPADLDSILLEANNTGGSNLCNVPGVDLYCAEAQGAGVTALVECTSLQRGLVYLDGGGQVVACAGQMDCATEGLGECLELAQSLYACGFVANVCAAFCEDPSGAQALTCPAGSVCAEPQIELDLVPQGSVDAPVPCANNADCDTVAGYFCRAVQGGTFCARKRKVCLDPTTLEQ